MAFDPQSPSELDRSRAHAIVWSGSACALLTFANLFVGMNNMLVVLAYGGAAGGMLHAALSRSTDEHVARLCTTGWRTMGAGLGIYLVAAFIMANGQFANSAGYWLSSGTMPPSRQLISDPGLQEPMVLAVLLATLFYAGFAFAWLRDRFGADE